MPVYCSRMFWGLTGTQHQLFIGILEPLCLPCCTIECIDFVTKLMKHAFSSQCQGRAPTVAMEALSSSGKKHGVTCTSCAMCVGQIVVHMCVYLYISVSLHVLCLYTWQLACIVNYQNEFKSLAACAICIDLCMYLHKQSYGVKLSGRIV